MSMQEVIDMLNKQRDRLVFLNKIKYPQYDPYVNGWDDCICFLQQHVERCNENMEG